MGLTIFKVHAAIETEESLLAVLFHHHVWKIEFVVCKLFVPAQRYKRVSRGTTIQYISDSQTVVHGPLVGHGLVLGGPQNFQWKVCICKMQSMQL